MAERSLDALSSDFYPKACEFLARVTARGVCLLIVQTRRTLAEHQDHIASGASNVTFSKHLPRHLRGFSDDISLGPDLLSRTSDLDKSDAMDVAPYDIFQLHGPDKLQWTLKDGAWLIIGEEAERLGLRWGGRWQKPVDPGHVELVLDDHDRWLAERARPWPPPALT